MRSLTYVSISHGGVFSKLMRPLASLATSQVGISAAVARSTDDDMDGVLGVSDACLYRANNFAAHGITAAGMIATAAAVIESISGTAACSYISWWDLEAVFVR